MKKKAVSVICAFAMTACCLPMQAQAKVIEPEIVKTEKWTASYFIDDKMDTLYPYFDCQADIYNDGTVQCFYWNTHEWDGFKTVKHTITPLCSEPVCTDSEEYKCVSEWLKGNPYNNNYFIGFKRDSSKKPFLIASQVPKPETIFEKGTTYLQLSYYPPEYSCKGNTFFTKVIHDKHELVSDPFPSEYLYSVAWNGALYSYITEVSDYNCYMPDFPVNSKWSAVFTPKVDPVGEYTICYLGHEIHITPELLSGNIIATPQLTEQEQYVKQLEEENAALKAENEQLKSQISILSKSKFCDVNQDGIVDVEDAQLVLIYYTESVAGLTDDTPIEIWYTKRNTTAG